MSEVRIVYETRHEFLNAIMDALKTSLKHKPSGYPFKEWLLKDRRFSRNETGLWWAFGNWHLTDDYLDYLISGA